MRFKLAEVTELTSPRAAGLAIDPSPAVLRTFGVPKSSGFGRQPAKRSDSTFNGPPAPIKLCITADKISERRVAARPEHAHQILRPDLDGLAECIEAEGGALMYTDQLLADVRLAGREGLDCLVEVSRPERWIGPAIYASLAQDSGRNDLIFDDVLKSLKPSARPSS